MPSSIDIEPTKGPLSSEYRQWVFNISKDVAEFNRLRPFLEQATKDTTGGGGVPKQTFPARVNYNAGNLGPFFYGSPCQYDFVELQSPFDMYEELEGGRSGQATNTMEYDLCPPGFEGPCVSGPYIPPGITSECMEMEDEEGPHDLDYIVFPIGWRGEGIPPSAIVTMHETIATEDLWGPGTACGAVDAGSPFYYFCLPNAFCVHCQNVDEGDPP